MRSWGGAAVLWFRGSSSPPCLQPCFMDPSSHNTCMFGEAVASLPQHPFITLAQALLTQTQFPAPSFSQQRQKPSLVTQAFGISCLHMSFWGHG